MKIMNLVQNKGEKQEKNRKVSSGFRFTILAIILISLFCFAITPVTLQNDTFYTIKIGEHIQKYGVDMKDPFSWHEGLSYTYPHWLYDWLTYLLYDGFGMDGIYAVTCLLSIILGISLYFVTQKLTKNQVISFLVSLGAMYLIKSYIAARAQLVTFILFVWTIYFIEQFLSTKKKRYAIGLVIIPLVMANLHTAVWPFYFVLYLPYVAEYLVAVLGDFIFYHKMALAIQKLRINWLTKKRPDSPKLAEWIAKNKELMAKVDRIKIRREEENQNPYKIKIEKRKATKWLIVIMILCVLTGFLTPIGNTPFTYLWKTMEGNTTQNINEHLPMTLANQTEVICALVIFLSVLLFTKTKIRLADLCMLAGLTYLMFLTKRQVTMFALVGAIILARLIQDFYQRVKMDPQKLVHIMATPIAIILLIIFFGSISLKEIKDKQGDPYISEKSYPVQACNFILENVDLGKARFYNEYNYGSYLLFRGIPVFIDSRADLYAPEFSGLTDDIFMDFINTSSIGTFYEDTFEKYGITHVICYKNAKMNMIITKTNDPNYQQIYGDDQFVIYERLNATKTTDN